MKTFAEEMPRLGQKFRVFDVKGVLVRCKFRMGCKGDVFKITRDSLSLRTIVQIKCQKCGYADVILRDFFSYEILGE